MKQEDTKREEPKHILLRLRERLEAYKAQRDQLLANANVAIGHIAELEQVLNDLAQEQARTVAANLSQVKMAPRVTTLTAPTEASNA